MIIGWHMILSDTTRKFPRHDISAKPACLSDFSHTYRVVAWSVASQSLPLIFLSIIVIEKSELAGRHPRLLNPIHETPQPLAQPGERGQPQSIGIIARLDQLLYVHVAEDVSFPRSFAIQAIGIIENEGI
jgi:hypothetical protein